MNEQRSAGFYFILFLMNYPIEPGSGAFFYFNYPARKKGC